MTKNLKPTYLLILALTLLVSSAFAQADKRTTAYNYMRNKEWKKAQEYIDMAAENSSTSDDAKTWHYRALIYQGLASETPGQDSAKVLRLSIYSLSICSER